VVRDLRRDEPYLAYDDFDFDVCAAQGGDCYARFQVRMMEILESLKIIEQAIENLPAGPYLLGWNRKRNDSGQSEKSTEASRD
jgi:NADH-quinone oxidoreductase subunit D